MNPRGRGKSEPRRIHPLHHTFCLDLPLATLGRCRRLLLLVLLGLVGGLDFTKGGLTSGSTLLGLLALLCLDHVKTSTDVGTLHLGTLDCALLGNVLRQALLVKATVEHGP